MRLEEIRIYAEVLEQGLDFKSYLEELLKEENKNAEIKNIYSKKCRNKVFSDSDSMIDRVRKLKDFDVLISAIDSDNEYPILIIEYSTAVPTDDHRMQRSDVYFWGAQLKIPVLKISPKNKHMDQRFGGGDKLENKHEEFLAFHAGGLLKDVDWETGKADVLNTKHECLSCINKNEEIKLFIRDVVLAYTNSTSFQNVLNILRKNKRYIPNTSYKINDIRSLFPSSNRFSYDKSTDEMTIKINRFGHAMDPDRGILFFWNLLCTDLKPTVEFQMERGSIEGKGGYESLFDGLSNEKSLIEKVKGIVQGQMCGKEALKLFVDALGLSRLINVNSSNDCNSYRIDAPTLEDYLKSNDYSGASKCLFLLCRRIILTNKDRQTIFRIEWNQNITREYISRCSTGINYTKTKLRNLSERDLNEDLITFSSVEIYKKLGCKLLAVSYPGAQGDRCILEDGKGRKNKRIYVDIIASKDSLVFLEEAKDRLIKSKKDIDKLVDMSNKKSEKFKWLKKFIYALDTSIKGNFDINISIAARKPKGSLQIEKGLDYLILFWVEEKSYPKVNIAYEIFICNINLVNIFRPLLSANKLSGTIQLPPIYFIDS